jgi:hypothetical protein
MIPAYIIDRIAMSELNGHHLATLLQDMAEAVRALNLPGSTLTLDYTQDDDPLQSGDLIPQIQLVLRRATKPDSLRPPFAPAEAATDIEDV